MPARPSRRSGDDPQSAGGDPGTTERENRGNGSAGGPGPRHHLLESWGVAGHAYPLSGIRVGSPRTFSLFP